jgi:glycosyltransferase involved in cell wall biosynthesis
VRTPAIPRILLCSPTPIKATLGASKVYIEAAEGFRRLGWEVSLAGPDEVAGGKSVDLLFEQPHYLRSYLRKHADAFDVVEYEHHALPFPRGDFSSCPLFVARSVLTAHAQLEADIPAGPTLRSRVRKLLFGSSGSRWLKRIVPQADRTLEAADLINVSNASDVRTLARHGHRPDKIVVFPFGLFPERSAAFRPTAEVIAAPAKIAFLGSFDPRKGMVDLPRIATRVIGKLPGVVFKLIGTAGMISTAEGVLTCFSRNVRPNVQVIPRFEPDELPELLADCTAAVFPSRVEGFPFGVLEMLAAGLPVMAYDVPGPPMMLPPEFLVPRGDAVALADKLLKLLADRNRLIDVRRWARRRSLDFGWDETIGQTARSYRQRLAARHSPAQPAPSPV